MEVCVQRRQLSPCFAGLPLIVLVLLTLLLIGVVVALLVRRLCCPCRSPVGHAADEEVAAEDPSKDFSNKKFFSAFAVAAQRVLEHDDPKSISSTMVRSPGASPEPARRWRLTSPQASAIRNSASSRPHGAASLAAPLSVPGGQNPPPAVDPCLPDIAPVSQRPLKEFSYESLAEATRSFDGGNELGRGGSGVLYTGDLVFDDGLSKEVAIKMFHRNIIDRNQIREDLRRKKYFLQHRNLVTLFGYCLHEGRLYLVYDLMRYYSLDYELFFAEKGAAKPVLTLAKRCHIIKDAAQGLYQLHKSQAFHGAVKASNIMIEPCSSGFRARLGDFRYSKLLLAEQASDLTTATTLASLLYRNPPAPEHILSAATGPSLATDMLHFGGVMLEVVCGRRLSDRDHLPAGYSSLVEWVRALQRGRRLHVAVDENMKKAGDFDNVQANELLSLGLQCSDPDPKQRPSVGNVLVKLAEIATEGKIEPVIVRQVRKNVSNTKRVCSASM